jgi:outer membrane lipoprotein-sorting protein
MTGTGQARFIAIMLSGLIVAGSAVMAETVPLPVPAPQPKTGGVPPPAVQSVRPGGAIPNVPGPSSAAPSWLPPFFGGPAARPETSAFDPAQRALAERVSTYLSSVQVLSGNFVQRGADGRQSKGHFYIHKPGKVRFEYDPPVPIQIISDGTHVVVRDTKLATQDPIPLSQTPLRFLLADRINLLRDTNVVGIYADDMFVTIVIDEKHPLVGTNRLMMMFGAKDFQLKQWIVTDPQGYDTTVAVSELDSTRRPDPNMFKIDYTRYGN